MHKFFIILSDIEGRPDYLHPSELNGTSKKEVFKLISEDVPQENIIGVYSEAEYVELLKSSKVKCLDFNAEEMSSNEYFDSMLNLVQNDTVSKNTQNDSINLNENFSEQTNQRKITLSNSTELPNELNDIKYFIDNGIEFKLENNKLYKRCWKTVELEENTDNQTNEIIFKNYRIINKTTKKPIINTKYEIQILDWTLVDFKNN